MKYYEVRKNNCDFYPAWMRRPMSITATFPDFRKMFFSTDAADNLLYEVNRQQNAQTLNP